MKTFFQNLLISAVALLLAGCSTFNSDWKRTAHSTPPAQGLAGAWEGRWLSDLNGHDGNLRCIMTQTSENNYDARFRAKYKKILSFEYTVPLKITRDANSIRFEGSADLGKVAGGLYTYKGAASGDTFFSTYDSKYDHGKFEMRRAASQ